MQFFFRSMFFSLDKMKMNVDGRIVIKSDRYISKGYLSCELLYHFKLSKKMAIDIVSDAPKICLIDIEKAQ